jgi:hypothetical protein
VPATQTCNVAQLGKPWAQVANIELVEELVEGPVAGAEGAEGAEGA